MENLKHLYTMYREYNEAPCTYYSHILLYIHLPVVMYLL